MDTDPQTRNYSKPFLFIVQWTSGVIHLIFMLPLLWFSSPVLVSDVYEGVMHQTIKKEDTVIPFYWQGTDVQWIFSLSSFELAAAHFFSLPYFCSWYFQITASGDFSCSCDPATVLQNQSQLFQTRPLRKRNIQLVITEEEQFKERDC